jgi:hypothetical protein
MLKSIPIHTSTEPTKTPFSPTPPTSTEPLVPPTPHSPPDSDLRIPNSGSGKEYVPIQELQVPTNATKKGKGWHGGGVKRRICLNAGRAKSKKTICDIIALHRKGYSNYRIGKELGISHMTVGKYLTRGTEIPQARVEVITSPPGNLPAKYDPRESLTHTLNQIVRMKAIYDNLLDDRAVPPVLTPLNLLQLAQVEKTVLQMPGEIAKQQADLYEQIHNRRLTCDDEEIAELGQAGEMGS